MRRKITTVLIILCCELCIVNCFAKSKVVKEKPNQSAYLKPIAPDKLKEDLDFLFKTIEEVHPNIYAYISEEKYATIRHELYKHFDHAMNVSEFYLYVHTAVSCLKDSHTRAERPSNFIMPPITESMRALGERLKRLVEDDGSSWTDAQYVPAPRKKEYTGPYSYHFFPEYDTCLIVINWFGMPDQIGQYAKMFQETLKEIREKGVTHLVIDVRENSGGCGLAGDELLKYLVNKPFRQIEKVEQRIFPAFFELCEQYGLNINQVMADEYGIDVENLKSKRDYKPGITVTGQVPFKNPHKSSDRFKGSIYLLIARPTFSAASNFAASVKFFKTGILIGQETSGKKDHYGQVVPIQLPNSGLKGQVSTAHFLTVGGMEDSGGVKPDYEVRQKPEDTAKGRDTVLEFTLNLISSSGAVSSICL
ncbi:MAG: hypothetical protein H8D56_02570 [Planctomycetes bacterium]|nr:hypothetical protein [Planctomycetota bacterium]MBL7145416.1 hypothetical protein [Phycisphaerae bacterium]